MASRHEAISKQVAIDWTEAKRGRLYNCSQGMATPIGADHPIWFGPMTRKFKGFPDKFGYELVNNAAIFCTVEVKTKKDRIKPDQKRTMAWLSSQGVRCYVAWEDDKQPNGYRLERSEA